MITTTENRTTVGSVLALGFLLATLIATVLLQASPADAAAPSGKAFAWGENSSGQLGNGNTGTDSSVPVAIKNLTGVKSVKSGGYHELALLDDGTVYAWGFGENGRLGNGTSDSSNVPVKVKIRNVKSISAGYDHSLALKNDGTVWAWGYNGFGELGNGSDDINSSVPVRVANLTGVKAVSAGQNFSLALMENGTVRSWGYDVYGQLGNGDTNANQPVPVNVENLKNVIKIAAPELGTHALALNKNGDVFFWGKGPDGDATEVIDQTHVPMKVQNVSDVKSIDAGQYFSLFLMQDGTVKSLGENEDGQLGDGYFQSKGAPVFVKDLTKVKAVSAGNHHALALKTDGTVYAWGSDYAGQLGDGPDAGNDENEPDKIERLSDIESVSAGFRTSFASK